MILVCAMFYRYYIDSFYIHRGYKESKNMFDEFFTLYKTANFKHDA